MGEIKTLSIDIETYSDIDLSKCGVYKYTESAAFDILLFGYAINGGEVQVIDLACGESIPAEVIAALTDDSVTKWAFNASFERVCLSAWLRKNYPQEFYSYSIEEDTVQNYLAPESWRCSMIWSAYMGLPLSLAGAGAVLGLEEQKLKEGKDLIRYFCVPCKPTKVNGGRTRNLPEHDMEKWKLFKVYNKRDVEVEMSIQKRLSRYPVPDFVWDEYHIDQEINDRGIALDMTMVENAITMDEKSKEELHAALKRITNLENPNSVMQMKQWLSGHGNGYARQKVCGRTVKDSAYPISGGAFPSAAACKIISEEIPGDAECSVCRWESQRNVSILWCEPLRQMGGQIDTAAEPSSKSYAGLGTGTGIGAVREF